MDVFKDEVIKYHHIYGDVFPLFLQKIELEQHKRWPEAADQVVEDLHHLGILEPVILSRTAASHEAPPLQPRGRAPTQRGHPGGQVQGRRRQRRLKVNISIQKSKSATKAQPRALQRVSPEPPPLFVELL